MFGTKAGPQLADAIRAGEALRRRPPEDRSVRYDTVLKAESDTEDFSEQWQIFRNKVAVALAPVAEKLFNTIGQGMTFVNANAGPALEALRSFGATLAKSLNLGSAFSHIADGLKSAADVIRDVVHGDWSKAWNDARKVVVDALDALIDVYPQLVHKIGSVYAGLGGAILKALGLGEFANAFSGAIQRIFDGWGEIFKGELEVLKGIVSGNWAEVWKGLKDVVEGAFKVVTGEIEAAGTLVVAAITKLAQLAGQGLIAGFSALGTLIENAAVGLGKAIVDGIGAGITGIVDLVSGLVGQIPPPSRRSSRMQLQPPATSAPRSSTRSPAQSLGSPTPSSAT